MGVGTCLNQYINNLLLQTIRLVEKLWNNSFVYLCIIKCGQNSNCILLLNVAFKSVPISLLILILKWGSNVNVKL